MIDSFALEFVTKFFLLQFPISDNSSLLWDFRTPKLSSEELNDGRLDGGKLDSNPKLNKKFVGLGVTF